MEPLEARRLLAADLFSDIAPTSPTDTLGWEDQSAIIVATEDALAKDHYPAIDFRDHPVGSFDSAQDSIDSTAEVLDSGSTLHVSGNAWKQLRFPYEVTPSTVLEFDFRSPAQGEIHGIGLENGTAISASRIFRLYGTQPWGISSFDDYSPSAPEWRRYRIPVGEFYTGTSEYLVFANDHDVSNPTAESYFRNMTVYEPNGGNPLPVANDDFYSVDEDDAAVTLDVLANDTFEPGETPVITSVTVGSAGGSISVVGGTAIDYRPAPDFHGTETFSYTLNDGTPGRNATATVTISVNSVADVVDDIVTPPEASSVTVDVLANDTFAGTAAIASVTQGADGSASIANAAAAYGPHPGFQEPDLFIHHETVGPVSESGSGTITVGGTGRPAVDFWDHTIGSYGGTQDTFSTAEVQDSGATLHLAGNGWKQIPFPYEVTQDTVLEFDFRSPIEGEIHGIGLDDDLELSQSKLFQMLGTQDWGIREVRGDSQPASPWQSYRIPVGEFYTGTSEYLVFANDHDVSNPTAESYFRNVTVYEANADVIDFRDHPVGSFDSAQDTIHSSAEVLDGGSTLHVRGNAWKQIQFPYDVTPDTVLEFDFRSPAQGEIHGIGLEDDTAISESRMFQLYGTQSWGISNSEDHSQSTPQWRSYRIPVGEFYTGASEYLVFANDHDVSGPTAESYFRNVTVYEANGGNPLPVANDDQYSVDEDDAGVTLDVLGNDTFESGETPVITSVTSGSAGGSISVVDGTAIEYRPAPDFHGTETFSYTVNDGIPGNDATAMVTITVNSVADDVNTVPVATNDHVVITHGQTYVFVPSQLVGNDVDADGDPLAITSVADATGGTVVLRQGLVHFTPAMHHGQDADMSFQYLVSDGRGSSSAATVLVSPSSVPHGSHGDEGRQREHNAVFDFVDRGEVTAVAVRSGVWSDAGIWHNGVVPRAGDKVLVHDAVDLVYDIQSDVGLEWLRVDGSLSFATDRSTRILVETFVVSPDARIDIGTATESVDPGVIAEILVDTSGGALSLEEDPTLVSRGFINHGETNIYGAAKTDFSGLGADALAGDETITLADGEIPEGWRVGDTLLLVGTHTDMSLSRAQYAAADADNARFHDELLQITGIDATGPNVQIAFNNVTNQAAVDAGRTTLLWDHTRPDGETFDPDELTIHVANLTRNVVVRSSDASVPTQERGHFMIMHNADANVHNALFQDLGRSDKTKVVDDPPVIGNFDGSPGTGTNPRGRYGLHLHRVGATSWSGTPAMVTGNVVWGTPGWGIVQHDSFAVLEDNVVFDVAGAGIVAEDGNELGLWRNNLSIKATGDGQDNFDDNHILDSDRGPRFDLGFIGSGYWIQGGGFGIRLENNVAASTNTGFDLVHHIDQIANVEYIKIDLIADPVVRQAFIDTGISHVTPNNVPTRGISGLEVYNSRRGIHTWLHNRDSGDFERNLTFGILDPHDFPSIVDDYTLWGVRQGVHNFYSAQFHYTDGLIVGNLDGPVGFQRSNDSQGNNSVGTGVSSNTTDGHDLHFDGLRIEGFQYGFQVTHAEPSSSEHADVVPFAVSSLRNATIRGVEYAFLPTTSVHLHSFSKLMELENVDASTIRSGNQLPAADFSHVVHGGGILTLDATASMDPDPGPRVLGDGIVAFAWDLDGDGDYYDAFGEQVRARFVEPGPHSVSLKVWDDQGSTATRDRLFVIPQRGPSEDVIVNGGFGDSAAFEPIVYWHEQSSQYRGDGWRVYNVTRNPSGFAEKITTGNGRLSQVVRDDNLRRGTQRLSFDLINRNGDAAANSLKVSVFGINGEWEDWGRSVPQPGRVGAKAVQVERLLDAPIGSNESGDWTKINFDVELGQIGYEYLYVRFDINTSESDYVAIDNVVMVGG